MFMLIVMIALCLAGIYSIYCSWMNYDWFFNNGRSIIFVWFFGREGARVFYIILGIAAIFLSFFSIYKMYQ